MDDKSEGGNPYVNNGLWESRSKTVRAGHVKDLKWKWKRL